MEQKYNRKQKKVFCKFRLCQGGWRKGVLLTFSVTCKYNNNANIFELYIISVEIRLYLVLYIYKSIARCVCLLLLSVVLGTV